LVEVLGEGVGEEGGEVGGDSNSGALAVKPAPPKYPLQ
jgi:hypothetical protein